MSAKWNCLNSFIRHEFITHTQTAFVSKKKEIDESEVIVEMDFAENYSHISQKEIQSVYFNKMQTSLHSAILTYKDGQIQTKSTVFISNCLDHNIQFVRTVQIKLMKHINGLQFKSNIMEQQLYNRALNFKAEKHRYSAGEKKKKTLWLVRSVQW